jgi:hypothetical protein
VTWLTQAVHADFIALQATFAEFAFSENDFTHPHRCMRPQQSVGHLMLIPEEF